MNINALKLLTAATVLVALASCGSDEEKHRSSEAVAMSFVADIDNLATRATATLFEAGDEVGIVPIKDGAVEAAYANIAYACDGAVFTANPPYYFQDAKSVIFNAYYPYESNLAAGNFVIDIDTRGENQAVATIGGHDWCKNDYLAASATADKTAPAVSFVGDKAFRHVMSSIVLKLKAGDGIANLKQLTGYTLGSLVVDGSFDCSKGVVATDIGATAGAIAIDGIACAETATEYTAEPLIVLPQEIVGGKCTLTVHCGGVDYTATLNLATLTAGVRYEFPVTIKKTRIEIGGFEIVDWTADPTITGDAELQ